MIIQQGDLLDIKEGYILQQVNCQNVMGAGLAKALYTKYPIIKTAFHNFSKDKHASQLIDELQSIKVSEKLTIINSYTQYSYGNSYKTKIVYTDEDLLCENLKVVDKLAQANGKQLYIAYNTGCGLAGGNFEKILDAIKNTNIIVIQQP